MNGFCFAGGARTWFQRGCEVRRQDCIRLSHRGRCRGVNQQYRRDQCRRRGRPSSTCGPAVETVTYRTGVRTRQSRASGTSIRDTGVRAGEVIGTSALAIGADVCAPGARRRRRPSIDTAGCRSTSNPRESGLRTGSSSSQYERLSASSHYCRSYGKHSAGRPVRGCRIHPRG